MSRLIRSVDEYRQGIARLLGWEQSYKRHFCQFMLTIVNILALVITINTSQFNFLWSIRSLDAITFIKTDQDFLQIFTSQRLNAVDCCLSNRVGLQSWECDNIPLIEAIKDCRQFHSICLLFVT